MWDAIGITGFLGAIVCTVGLLIMAIKKNPVWKRWAGMVGIFTVMFIVGASNSPTTQVTNINTDKVQIENIPTAPPQTQADVPEDQKILQAAQKYLLSSKGITPVLSAPYGSPKAGDTVVYMQGVSGDKAIAGVGTYASDDGILMEFNRQPNGDWVYVKDIPQEWDEGSADTTLAQSLGDYNKFYKLAVDYGYPYVENVKREPSGDILTMFNRSVIQTQAGPKYKDSLLSTYRDNKTGLVVLVRLRLGDNKRIDNILYMTDEEKFFASKQIAASPTPLLTPLLDCLEIDMQTKRALFEKLELISKSDKISDLNYFMDYDESAIMGQRASSTYQSEWVTSQTNGRKVIVGLTYDWYFFPSIWVQTEEGWESERMANN